MSTRRPVGPVDTMWLNMDRPNNLMIIDSVMWTDEPIDWDRFTGVITERMLDRFPVFRQLAAPPTNPLSPPHWEDDPAFDLGNHIVRATLAAPGDEEALQAYVEAQMHVSFDRAHPLWEFHYIDGFGTGSALVTRFHHSLADGIALSHVLLSLTDAGPDAEPERGVSSELAPLVRRPGGLMGAAASLTGAATSAVLGGLHLLSELPALTRPSALPSTVVDVLNLVQQSSVIANKLILGTMPESPIVGTPGVAKRAVWSEPLDIADVKTISRLTGATVNDILVGAVSGAIRQYVLSRGGDPADLVTMVPVNLRPPDEPLPRELGNKFALVLMPLPAGTAAPLQRLAEAKTRMDRIKISPESAITFGLIAGTGRTHPLLEKLIVDFFSSKAIGVTTNVVGPGKPRYLAGVPLTGVLGWVPGSGSQTLGICIFSYAGTVRVGFKADSTVITDAEKLVHAFESEMAELVQLAHAA